MLKNLIKLFYPTICLGCSNKLSNHENLICLKCRHELPLTSHLEEKRNEAYKKFDGKVNVEHVSSMTYYHKQGIVQSLIHNLKYKNEQEIGTFLGYWYADLLNESKEIDSVDYIIPVPLHPKRLKERGYNQIETFCKALSDTLNKPHEKNLLVRNQYASTQSKKGLIDRNKVNSTTFECVNTGEFHNKHFLLVDDVLTTGATLEACAKALLKIPNTKISIVTIAFSQS